MPGPTGTALLRSFAGDGAFGLKIHEGLKRAIPLRGRRRSLIQAERKRN